MNRAIQIVLDIGVNYYDIATRDKVAPLSAAKMMIAAAAETGAATVKFQTYKADKLAAKQSPAYWDLSEEPTMTQRELFKKFDHFNYADYEELALYCKESEIEFMTTAFDVESAEQVNTLVSRHKVASADITNIELLQKVGSFGKPVLLSTGASTKEEVTLALKTLEKAGSGHITLLHCVLNYPTAWKQANLWKIARLKKEFPTYRIGYSDHTHYNLQVLLTAYLLGAEVIEKHFTLDKSLKGNDHYHAADPEDIKEVIKMFTAVKDLIGSEQPDWFDPEEEKARRFARRGVYLNKDVQAGNRIRATDVAFLRPQSEGITPFAWAAAVGEGKKYSRNMPGGTLITAEMLH